MQEGMGRLSGSTPSTNPIIRLPASFSEAAVTGLQRHGKIWKWILKIGYEECLRPLRESQIYVKIQGCAPDNLKGLLGAFTKEAKTVVREWISLHNIE